jgi:bud site selection protein 31
MPKVRTKRKKLPAGWDVLEETLEALEEKMRDAEADPGDGKRQAELAWPIFRIHHQRSRYIFEMFKKKKISRDAYEYALREKYADAALIGRFGVALCLDALRSMRVFDRRKI